MTTATDTTDARSTTLRNQSPRLMLLAIGLSVGALLAYVLYEFFEPLNLFALNLQRSSMGTTNITTLSVGTALAFVSGVTMIFTPCGMPLVFSLNSIATEGRAKGRNFVPALALFTLGITLIMALWGVVVAFAGNGILDLLTGPSHLLGTTQILYVTLGILALGLALWDFDYISLGRLSKPRAMPDGVNNLKPYPRSFAMGAALGAGFGIGCPFPTYQAILIWAAFVGNPLYGAIVLGANALGRAFPLWIIASAVYRGNDQGTISRWLRSNSQRTKLINGTALAAFAGLMLVLWGYLIPFVLQPGA